MKIQAMKILVAGDFCPQQRVAELFEKGDYSTVLGEVKPIIEQADYSIVNFECPVCRGGEEPIVKQGPNLKCTEKGIEAVKWAGFDCVTLANNHFLDYGKEGVQNTLATCSKNGIDTVGGGLNLQDASSILYKEINGQRLAIINCCEHEFSIATEKTAGSNPLNPIQQYYAIKKARENADYVLVIVHGGHEMWQLPSLRMVETYRFFIDAGADVVVNHHQHCFSGYEYYKGKPIVYGLGNFCFDRGASVPDIWCEGYMVGILFSDKIEIKMFPYRQCDMNPSVICLSDKGAFERSIEKLNAVINDFVRLREQTKKYYEKEKEMIEFQLEAFPFRFLKRLRRIKLIPSSLTKWHLLRMTNMVLCEAHRDKLVYFLLGKHSAK